MSWVKTLFHRFRLSPFPYQGNRFPGKGNPAGSVSRAYLLHDEVVEVQVEPEVCVEEKGSLDQVPVLSLEGPDVSLPR
jgi:hypothetical protein